MSELGLHKSGTNTNDATAVATDILNSKTAYVKGAKVTGTQSLANLTSSANATASDIISGKSGYVNGVKVTGNIPIQGTQVATPYNTDVYGNFGMTVPVSGFYNAGNILYGNAAACGITPEKILQGQSILGVVGTVELGELYAQENKELMVFYSPNSPTIRNMSPKIFKASYSMSYMDSGNPGQWAPGGDSREGYLFRGETKRFYFKRTDGAYVTISLSLSSDGKVVTFAKAETEDMTYFYANIVPYLRVS